MRRVVHVRESRTMVENAATSQLRTCTTLYRKSVEIICKGSTATTKNLVRVELNGEALQIYTCELNIYSSNTANMQSVSSCKEAYLKNSSMTYAKQKVSLSK